MIAQGPEEMEVSERLDNQEITCFAMNKDIVLVAKEALANNLITAVLFIVIVPNRILSIIYYHMQPNIGEFVPYMLVNKIMLPFRNGNTSEPSPLIKKPTFFNFESILTSTDFPVLLVLISHMVHAFVCCFYFFL